MILRTLSKYAARLETIGSNQNVNTMQIVRRIDLEGVARSSRRFYCHVIGKEDDLETEGAGRPTLLKIKRSIKATSYELTDGYACILSKCPACLPSGEPDEATSKRDIYINKTTGLWFRVRVEFEDSNDVLHFRNGCLSRMPAQIQFQSNRSILRATKFDEC